MRDTVVVQYVGCEVKSLGREYTFVVLQAPNEPRKFTLTIVNLAFDTRRARFQDAPEICSLRLRRELALCANNPSQDAYDISDADLEDYRAAHAPKPKSGFGFPTRTKQPG